MPVNGRGTCPVETCRGDSPLARRGKTSGTPGTAPGRTPGDCPHESANPWWKRQHGELQPRRPGSSLGGFASPTRTQRRWMR